MFFSGSIVGVSSSAASELVSDYAEKNQHMNLINWPIQLFSMMDTLVDVLNDSFTTLNKRDIDVYKNIKKQNYRVVFDNCISNLPIDKIIDLCEKN